MVRNTKKAERAALAKQRRKIRVKMKAKQKARRSGVKVATKSHPHRKATALRASR